MSVIDMCMASRKKTAKAPGRQEPHEEETDGKGRKLVRDSDHMTSMSPCFIRNSLAPWHLGGLVFTLRGSAAPAVQTR